ncbi:MAG: response regulator [Rhodomicrobium sp.]
MSIFDDVELELEDSEELASAFPLGRIPAGGENMVVKGSLRSDQLVDVLLVTRDTEIKQKVEEAFKDKNYFSLRVVDSRMVQFQESIGEVKKPELLILDLNTANIIDTEALERIKKSEYADIPVVVISSYLDQDTVRTLVQIKVDDWLPKDCTPHDVYKSCERASRAKVAAAPKRERHATCYTFIPVSGGAGCTTLAIQAAFLLGAKNKQYESTCLVDLNFQDGAVADYLDLVPAFKVEELSTAPGRLDRQLLEVMLSRHSTGLAVLSAPRFPARYLGVSEGLVAAVLGLLSRSFDTLVVDLPRAWHPWTDNVIWGSNKVFIITPFTVPSLRQARHLADAIIAKASTTTKVSVIVNKYHEQIFGSGLQRRDVERLLGPRLIGFIPEVGGIVTEAINRGLPVSGVSSSHKLEKRLAEFIELDEAHVSQS